MSFFTRASYTRLMEELNRLRTEELPAVSRAKQAAAAEGDLSGALTLLQGLARTVAWYQGRSGAALV